MALATPPPHSPLLNGKSHEKFPFSYSEYLLKISLRKVNMKKKMLNHQEMFQSFSHKVFQNQIQTSTALVYENNSEKKVILYIDIFAQIV